MELRRLQVTTSAAVKEKRLHALLAGRDPASPELAAAVRDAQLAGSLELAGLAAGAPAQSLLLAAWRAVPQEAPFTVSTVVAWHRALIPGGGAFRGRPRPDA